MPPRHEVRQRDDQTNAAFLYPLAPCRGQRLQVGQLPHRRIERRPALVQQVGQREHQPLGAIVQPLPRPAEQRGQIGQPAFRTRQEQPPLLRQPVQAADQPRRPLLQVGDQFGPRRHRQLRRGGRRRRAAVGDKVDQRGVGLVPDRGDQRDAAGGDGAQDDLLIERHQVFQAAAAARHDQHVGRGTADAGSASNPAIAAAIRSAAPSPCTGTGHSRIGAREAARDRGADVLDHRAALAGHHADHRRQHRQRAACGRRRTAPPPARRRRSISMRASSAPAPAYSIRSVMSWYDERSA